MAVNMENVLRILDSSGKQPKRKAINRILKDKSDTFFQNRKNANILIDIMTLCESDNEDIQVGTIRTLHVIFSRLIQSKEMFLENETETNDANHKYILWLRQQYDDTTDKLRQFLQNDSSKVQELSLCTLMKFVEAESQTPLQPTIKGHAYFPVQMFELLVVTLLSKDHDLSSLIQRFQEFLEYDDVRFYVMKMALKNLHACTEKPIPTTYIDNMLTLLDNLSMSTPPQDDDKLIKFLSKPPEMAHNAAKYKEHKKLFSKLWLEFLKHQLSSASYRRVLINLHENVMPHMVNPLMLSDFLTESYNYGGAISLLALNGLFMLVNKFNLNYPDFYEKLYALFEPSIFHTKYCARFFYLADLFLSSTHLPGYLVAAFVKRLSRLALTAPPSSITVIVPFVFNLIRRHPNCEVLLNRENTPDTIHDPYIMDEPDPAKCQALDSSLWEIKTLQEHYYCEIALQARKMDKKLTVTETSIAELLDNTPTELFNKEIKKKAKTSATTFETPNGLFGNKDSKFLQLWNFDIT